MGRDPEVLEGVAGDHGENGRRCLGTVLMSAFDHHHGRYGRVLGGHKTDEAGNEIVVYITTLR